MFILNGVLCGAPRGIRTPGLQIRSLTLYPAELWALVDLQYGKNRG